VAARDEDRVTVLGSGESMKPIYGEARGQFDRELLSLAKL